MQVSVNNPLSHHMSVKKSVELVFLLVSIFLLIHSSIRKGGEGVSSSHFQCLSFLKVDDDRILMDPTFSF